MANTIDFALNADKGGGKLTSFTYSRSLGELVGTWSAEIANARKGELKAGSRFSVRGNRDLTYCMKGGYIEHVWTDPDGLTHLTGKDAGVELMRTTPPAKELAKGSASAVIQDLANFCGMDCSMTGSGLDGFDVRSAVTGTTCAEAILELAMLSGCIAYIDTDGKLRVRPPDSGWNYTGTVLDDSGSQLDLDGYATQVTVSVTRRKKTKAEITEGGEGGDTVHYRGTTPDGNTNDKTSTGSFSYTDGQGASVTGDYSITIMEPIGFLKRSETTIRREINGPSDRVTVKIVEDHVHPNLELDVKKQVVWRGNQQYQLLAWAEPGYKITKTTAGNYINNKGEQVSFEEVTTETMEREFSLSDAMGLSAEWRGQGLGMVEREIITRRTSRTSNISPGDSMPEYSPPFDMKITREYKSTDNGLGVICCETEIMHEARQIGQIAKLKKYNPNTGEYEDIKAIWDAGRYIALTSHTTPVWVPIVTERTTYEKYKRDGTCEVSTQAEWCDEGAQWILARGLPPTGDDEVDAYQDSYAKFTQKTSGLSVNVGGGGAGNVWQFLELPGKVITVESEDSEEYGVNGEEWYVNGGYAPSRICPHYDDNDLKCTIAGISAIGDFTGDVCPYQGKSGGEGASWQGCVRAKAALEQARYEEDRPLLEPPVVAVASISGSGSRRPVAGYQREFYIDNEMDESAAEKIAEAAAKNILKVKGTKGIRETKVIPLDTTIELDGAVVAVSHDFFNMQTTVSHRVSGDVPQFAIPSSVSGISDGVSGRNASRRTRPMTGTISDIADNGVVQVNINGMTYDCTTKLVNLAEGDAVLVSFSSGNSLHGHIIEKM